MDSLRKFIQNTLKEAHYTTWKKLGELGPLQYGENLDESSPIDSFQDQEFEIAQKLSKHFNIGKIAPLGSGTSGFAYYIPNNRVLKITKDKSEVAEAHKIIGKNLKHLANVYGTYTLGGKYAGTYVIISELLDKTDDIDDAHEFFNKFLREHQHKYVDGFLNDYRDGDFSKVELLKIKNDIQDNLEPYKAQLALWYMNGMMAIVDELKKNKILSTDWGTTNLGIKKSGNLAMYDLGYGDPEVPSSVQNISLNEKENVIQKTNGSKWIEYSTKDKKAYADVANFGDVWHIAMIESKVKGGGTAIVNKIIEDAKKAGVKKITLTTTEFSGFGFFDKLGFKEVGENNDPHDIPMEFILTDELGEGNLVFVQNSKGMEYPDFFDGQNNPLFKNRAYIPAMNLNNTPLAEDIIQEKMRVAEKTKKYILDKMNIPDAQYYKSGGYGDAYISNGKIIKFTTDFKEAKLANEFLKHKFKHIANIEKVLRYQESKNQWIYIIILEKLQDLTPLEIEAFRVYERARGNYNEFIGETGDDQTFEETLNNIDAPYLKDFFEPWVIERIKRIRKEILGVNNMMKTLKKEVGKVMPASEVEASLSDFHPYNMGRKADGTIAFFDLQWIGSNEHPKNVETIKETEISQEDINKKQLPYKFPNMFDDFVQEVTELGIREVAPAIDLNQPAELLVKSLETNYPALFDNFAEWIFNKQKKNSTLNEESKNLKQITWKDAVKQTSQSDVKDIASWLSKPVSEIQFFLSSEPIESFAQQIKDMENSYLEFPEDEERSRKIYDMLLYGEPVKPVFVARGDSQKFIMEGRHRIVAFSWFNLKTVPVIYVA